MLQKSVQRSVQPAFIAVAQRDFAVSEKQLKIRMKSVGSIGKITAAMKMVSASKMKGDLQRLAAGKDFGSNAVDMIFKSDQFMQRKMPSEPADPQTLIVPITSDKGLCGAINSIIVRDVKKLVAQSNRQKLAIYSIGEKGSLGFTRPFPDLLKYSISQIGTPYNYPTVMAMAVGVMNSSQNADKITVVYNEFKSAISSVVAMPSLTSQRLSRQTASISRSAMCASISLRTVNGNIPIVRSRSAALPAVSASPTSSINGKR